MARSSWRPGPWLHIVVDPARGIALVRGPDAKDACIFVGAEPGYSSIGRGWVVDREHVADLEALAKYEHLFVAVSTRRQARPRREAS